MTLDPSSTPTLESQISDWLINLINKDEIHDYVLGADDVAELARVTAQKGFIPTFTIDYLSRNACAKAAHHVLSQLYNLEIIAVNKSISLQTGEILKPDIIAFNRSTRCVLIFEIKRDVATERQAVTELMAYEHEVQNNFPFLSHFDLCFVIVARNWSTLMDHAVGSMVTWSNKQCLALALDLSKPEWTLSLHMPSAWSLIGSYGVPPEALQAVDLVLYEDKVDDDPYPPSIVFTALQIIARNGDRANTHGFVMLWRDHSGLGNARWIMTICAIDPTVLFFHSRRESNPLALRESEMSAFFEDHADDLAYGFLPSGATKIAAEAISILRPRYNPHWENFMGWHEKLAPHKKRAFPLHFEFWGKLGEYVRELVVHPDVRSRMMPYIQANEIDWTYPGGCHPFDRRHCGTPAISARRCAVPRRFRNR